ncbi:S-adenosyl-L-methionine-dependent methyltransferase [Fusarium flagelliforme]|uniref:S-adenosyl-L-methionine-dependent methyltransferase n=1 Tax=Fusarium flagelliforme TaxID=2675880 RepID=UPI001E8DD146|nr:S-adenosyl-L-methionine-dependent methyltransferase [Fusarium flagelliforme]KAH7191821.1 S-adenosyl-L-methionine-dependent methyltransferase [Fusarium flagelliforme]
MGSIGPSTNSLIATLDNIHPSQFNGDEVERLRVRAAARRLLARLETPNERAWGFDFEQPAVNAAIQTCIDLGLWKAWTENGGGKKTIDELVKITGRDVEPNLLRRLFRIMAAFYVVEETGEDTFKPTPFSHAIGDENTGIRGSLEAGSQTYISAALNLPKYLAKNNYREPTAATQSNFAASDPDGLNYFDRLQKTPEFYEAFTCHMETWTAWKTPWTKIYDVDKLLDGADLSKPFVVDVGGNTGIDIQRVLEAKPDLPGGVLFLQDLKVILEKVDVDERIVVQVHDFFTPQPVTGARAYFMHAVFHDWPDAEATTILTHTRDAMTKGYSKLFIYDIVIPATGASISQTTMDVQMMSLLSSAERTKSQWENLLTGAGFKIVNFWPDPQQYEMLIEAEVI